MTPFGRCGGSKLTPPLLDTNAALLESITTQNPVVASAPGAHDTALICPG
jgi:hypothetical protein